MTLTAAISTNELARVAYAAYAGRRVRVALANVGSTGYGVDSPVANWELAKIGGSGYADSTDVVDVGAYDATDARFELGSEADAPYILAEFTASGGALSWDRVFVVIGTDDGAGGWDEELYLHSLLVENPGVTLADGQSVTYRIQLYVND
jgi:hypothetical protein